MKFFSESNLFLSTLRMQFWQPRKENVAHKILSTEMEVFPLEDFSLKKPQF